jgi:hypothetical protein
VITGLTIANGASFMIRWLDFNASGSDDGMGIDDFSIKPCGTTSAPTAADQSFCSSTSPTVSNLTATGTSIQWYAASSGGSALSTSTALTNSTVYASQTLTGCESATRASSTITLSADNTASAASSSPTLSINTALTAITQTTTGATGASGTFSYSIPLTGGCGSVNATGTITVTANNNVGVASSSPTLCINTALTAITHTTTGATGIGTATGLPAGVTAAWASNTITISGTPTASGTFAYSIPLTGVSGSVNATGTIVVSADNTVGAASSSPTLSINTALTAITQTTTGATGIGTATGLPAGVTAAWATNTITISGTPTASGTFSYSIPLTGGCGSVNATGTINVVGSCPTDLNNDVVTDVNDFLIFAPAFGTTNASASPTDLNSDGVTDVNDFLIFAPEFGTPCN